MLHRVGGHRRRDLDEDGAHQAALQGEHHEQPLAADPHQLQPLQHQSIERRRDGDSELLGQHAEHLGRAPQNLLDRVPRGGNDLALQLGARAPRHRTRPHELIDVQPVAALGGDPPAGSVGVKEIALGLELAHRAAHRGRRDAQPRPPRGRLASGRLRGLDVDLDDCLEHPELALAQRFAACHNRKTSNELGWPPARRV